jgi:hypothetical protein
MSIGQEAKLSDLVQMTLKTVRAYLLKEDFQNLWEYKYSASGAKFLDQWCTHPHSDPAVGRELLADITWICIIG